MQSRKDRKKTQFSKILLILDYIITIALIVSMIYLTIKGYDINYSLTVITGAWITQLGVSTGFYYNKSKEENKIKCLNSLSDELKKNTSGNFNIN